MLWIDLLTDHDEERYGRFPDNLSKTLVSQKYKKVVIDEIQKSPKLLDVVHKEIEGHPEIQFILTGSSARKLKRGMGNLLGRRAFNYQLFPLTYRELGKQFDLDFTLRFGTLPKIFNYKDDTDIMEL